MCVCGAGGGGVVRLLCVCVDIERSTHVQVVFGDVPVVCAPQL